MKQKRMSKDCVLMPEISTSIIFDVTVGALIASNQTIIDDIILDIADENAKGSSFREGCFIVADTYAFGTALVQAISIYPSEWDGQSIFCIDESTVDCDHECRDISNLPLEEISRSRVQLPADWDLPTDNKGLLHLVLKALI